MRVARQTRSKKPRSRQNRWLLGLTIGLVFGVASLVGGTIAWAVTLVTLVLPVIDQNRIPLVGGACLGFAATWLAIILLADSRCGEGCSGPDITPWLVAGATLAVVGAGLSLLSLGSRRANLP